MCPDMTLSARMMMLWRKRFVYARDVPSGDIHTTINIEACDEGSLSMDSIYFLGLKGEMSLIMAKYHFLAGYQLNSRSDHLIFEC